MPFLCINYVQSWKYQNIQENVVQAQAYNEPSPTYIHAMLATFTAECLYLKYSVYSTIFRAVKNTRQDYRF